MTRFTDNVPAWVIQLAEEVWLDQPAESAMGAQDVPPSFAYLLRRGTPHFGWAKVSEETSSGYTTHMGTRINIRAGRDVTDQVLVVLHELAHALNPLEDHTARYWHTAFALYERYGIVDEAKWREAGYMRKAIHAAYQRGHWTPEQKTELLRCYRLAFPPPVKINGVWFTSRGQPEAFINGYRFELTGTIRAGASAAVRKAARKVARK